MTAAPKPVEELLPEDLDRDRAMVRSQRALVEHLLYSLDLLGKLRALEIQAKTFVPASVGEATDLKREVDEFLLYFDQAIGR